MSGKEQKAAELARLLEERAELGRKLEVSLALEAAFPDIFKNGSVSISMPGSASSRPLARIEGKDGPKDIPLEEMPEAYLRSHADFIRGRARGVRSHPAWKKAEKRINSA
jgi:hypothetical protein